MVTSTKESGSYYQRLHALDVVTHAEKFGGPVVISGSYGGTAFSAYHQLNRAALLLINTHVVVAFGQHCNNEGYGWVFSYNKTALASGSEAVYNTDPRSIHGSVWMGGSGVAADSSGNLFFATGDGDFDGVTYFGDSIIKLGSPSGGTFPFLDYFTPFNQAKLDYCDYDVGSGGVLLLPDLPPGSAHQHLLVQAGKEGTIYLIDRDKMGNYCSGCASDTNIVQEQSDVLTGLWGSPAYWNGNIYFGSTEEPAYNGCGNNIADHIKAYSFNSGGDGLLSTFPTSQTPETFVWPNPSPSVSSNGTANGIVWALENSSYGSACCGVLHAYDATNLATELYNSNTNSGRDQLGGAIKFSVPTVANGKVYVGTQNQLTVLSTGLPSASISPTHLFFSYPCDNPPNPQTVTLTNNGPGALMLESFPVQYTKGYGFVVSPLTCSVGSHMQPGSSCTLSISYGGPTGSNIGTLEVNVTAANSPETVSLSGFTGSCGPP